MLLASLDWGDKKAPCIRLPHMARAIDIAEEWRASAHLVLEEIGKGEFESDLDIVRKIIAKNEPRGATIRDIWHDGLRRRKKSLEDTQNVVNQMLQMGDIVGEASPTNKPGPRTTYYHIRKG
jgi:hypothetical protein